MPPLFCLTIVKGDDILLHEKPATNWEKQVLPLWNGRLGAKGTFLEDFFSGGRIGISACLPSICLPTSVQKRQKMGFGPSGGDFSLEKERAKVLIWGVWSIV